MRRSRLLGRFLAPALLIAGLPLVASADVPAWENDGVTASLDGTLLKLSNDVVERSFRADRLVTFSIDAYGTQRATGGDDFSIGEIGSSQFNSVLDQVYEVDGGLKVVRHAVLPNTLEVTRTIELYGGIAGFRSQTTLKLLAPFPLTRYALDHIVVEKRVTPTAHSFRAGADWRYDEAWAPAGVGDSHPGPWRSTTKGGRDADFVAFGEWLELAYKDGARAALVSERHDYASSRVEMTSNAANNEAETVVDLARDIVYTGPIEESAHIENPAGPPAPGRVRVIPALTTLDLEPSYLAFGRDEDEVAANVHAMLAKRSGDYQRRIVFNTNNVDANAISTGAKDDVNFATFKQLVRAARAAGIDTFVLDDGWQAASGDWCPDSPECRDPRAGADPVKFAPRFPDSTFSAVQAFLKDDPETPQDDADLDLGLWMTPMEFHPSSSAFQTNPQWACLPVGVGTAALSIVQPDSSSNEAGLGVWNPLAIGRNPEVPTQTMTLIDWIESRIERAINIFGAKYFKFDFLAWIDCAGVMPVDMYQYREAFLGMVDSLRSRHDDVLFTIDETNDYRMFPYESVTRGATWFQNGSPKVDQTLHNIWDLAPYVPGYALGQGVASRGDEIASLGIDPLMAAGVTSHMTIWRDLRGYAAAELAKMKAWNDWYRANADTISTFTMPLLADPLTGGWTALQPWDHRTSSGWVLAYRQGDARDEISIPLRGLRQVPGTTAFDVTLVDPATGGSSASLGTLTAAELRTGALTLGTVANGYVFARITPA